jgi:GAF domain-containing protein
MNRTPSAHGRVSATALEAGRRIVERYAREAVPALADFCLVHLAAGRTIRCIAATHATRSGTRTVRALMATHRIRQDDRVSTVAHVIRTGRAALRTAIQPERTDEGPDRVTDLHRRLAPTSALVVPIQQHTHVVGAVSLCYSQSGRSYRARDIAAARRLASRIAAALSTPTINATPGLHAAARHTGQGPSLRRRVAARN